MKTKKYGFLATLLIAVLVTGTSPAATFYWDADVQGNWNDNINWVNEFGEPFTKPDGMYEVKIKHAGSIVTVDTVEGDWDYTGTGTRLRVYQGATMNIVDGADLRGFGWIRIGEQTGTPEQIGSLNQSGGRIFLRHLKEGGKLGIGDGFGIAPGSTYIISGGILTYDMNDSSCDGHLLIGSRDGNGTFIVAGSQPVIQMNNLYVAGDMSGGIAYNHGTAALQFMVGSTGVSSINLDGTAYIDQGTDTLANLIVSLTEAPPTGEDIILINANTAIVGTFDSLNSVSAIEGAHVTLDYGSGRYNYSLTYTGGLDGMDIALLWVPEPATVILMAFGLISVVRKR